MESYQVQKSIVFVLDVQAFLPQNITSAVPHDNVHSLSILSCFIKDPCTIIQSEMWAIITLDIDYLHWKLSFHLSFCPKISANAISFAKLLLQVPEIMEKCWGNNAALFPVSDLKYLMLFDNSEMSGSLRMGSVLV